MASGQSPARGPVGAAGRGGSEGNCGKGGGTTPASGGRFTGASAGSATTRGGGFSTGFAGGPTGAQLFNQVNVAIETACLLASSYTCGLMSVAVNSQRRGATYFFAAVTFVLGAVFLTLEIREFADMIARGASPQRSAFLSAFFTLVGCHGLHVAAGLIFLTVMMAQVAINGYRATVERRLLCFALFWHALDIIWVWLFTIVYLMGVRS